MKHFITIFTILLLATTATADNKEKADQLFKQGKKLMEQKRFADACASFEKSYKLDPGIGAQLNIAKCYQEWGKIGQAYIAYVAAEKAAKAANDDRAPKIHEYVAALEPDIPHLTINLPKDIKPEQIKVTLDGQPLTTFGEPIVVDPGPHMIEYYVSGSGRKQNQVVPLERGGKQDVTLEIQKPKPTRDPNAGDPKPDEPIEKPVTTGRNQRIAGIALGGGGLAAILVSTIMTVAAKSKYNDALAMYCGGMTNNCDPMGLTLTHEARSTANQATIVFLLGTAMVGGGVALYLLAPRSAPASDGAPAEEQQSLYLVPSVGPNSAGIVFGGRL